MALVEGMSSKFLISVNAIYKAVLNIIFETGFYLRLYTVIFRTSVQSIDK